MGVMVKYKVDGTVDRFKACLMAKGFQQMAGVDFLETFSSIIEPSTVRVISLAVTHRWNIQQVDISNAFLNGSLQEKIFMLQPEEFEDQTRPQHVCKLKKAFYGLK